MADDAEKVEVKEAEPTPNNDYSPPPSFSQPPADNDEEGPAAPQEGEGEGGRVTEPQAVARNRGILLASSEEEELEKNRVLVKIMLLDNTDCSITCPRKVKAADVIDYVHSEVDTEEKDFFSVYFFVENQKIFLDPEKTIVHQLPATMRAAMPWVLYYGVKFYHPDPTKLKVDYSRYLYALQLCTDIRANRVLSDVETAKRLTALMLQATLGDYNAEDHKAGYTDDFEDFHLIPRDNRADDYEADLINYHSAKTGYTPAQAESEFCDVARKLPRYGYHLFTVQDDHSNVCLVANGFHGIQIFQEREQIHFFKWPHIVKISYKRRKFRIKYHPVDSNDVVDIDAVEQLKYYCGKQPASKRIWKNAVEQHTFFRLNVPDPPNRINFLFRRGSRFRYSGRTLRQTMSGETPKPHDFQRSHSERLQRSSYQNYAPGYVPAHNSFRRPRPQPVPPQQPTQEIFIEKEDQMWVQLDAPPTNKAVDQSKTEQQRVQVNFSLQDGLPDDQFKAVLKRSGDSMEVLPNESNDTTEPTYKLTPIDQNSQAILTSVSVMIDPEEGAEPGSHGDSSVVFDSSTLPSVKLNADTTTSSTVMESSGKTVTTGGVTHSFQYSSDCVDGDAAPDMGQSDTPETVQVELFIEREGELLKEVLSASATEGNNEVED